jgi:hypothetical protein
MSEGLLTFAAFGAGMTVIGLYLVCLYLVADALLDRLARACVQLGDSQISR